MTIMGDSKKDEVRMAGYLQKKGGMKLMPAWKQYWFVLEGHLLLYYRSQLDYLNLSVCKGSINMGLASSILPGLSRPNIIEIITRTQVITLRAKDRIIQEQWLQALLDSMSAPMASRLSTGSMQLRYSLDNLPVMVKDDKTNNTSSEPKRPSVSRQDSILSRIRKLGGRSYGTGSFETVVQRNERLHKTCEEGENDKKISLQRTSQDGSQSSMYAEVDSNLHQTSHNADISNELCTSLTVKNGDKECEDRMYEQIIVNRIHKRYENSSNEYNEPEYHESQENLASYSEPAFPPVLKSNSESQLNYQPDENKNEFKFTEPYENNNVNINEFRNENKTKKQEKKHSLKINARNKPSKSVKSSKENTSKSRSHNSFLRTVLGHYHKKMHPKTTTGHGEQIVKVPEEPSYEDMEFCLTTEETEANLLTKPRVKDICKQSLLPSNALTELQEKLRISKDTEDSNIHTNETCEETNEAEEYADKSSDASPPALPPRHSAEQRPTSPSHDVPTNNSPVISSNISLTLSQDQQDSLLGTPEGFALLRSKWQKAEQGDMEVTKKEEDGVSHLYSKINKKSKAIADERLKIQDKQMFATNKDDIFLTSESDENNVSAVKTVKTDSSDNTCMENKKNTSESERIEDEIFQQDSLMSNVSMDIENESSHFSSQCPGLATASGKPEKYESGNELEDHYSNRNSNDLNLLLAQLAEITSAPLLTPGTTTSLVNYPESNMTDQFSLLLPVRRRRHSEPDYDIPRPHQLILLRNGSPSPTESPTVADESPEKESLEDGFSCNLSITPDSLEPITNQKEDFYYMK